MASRYAFLSVEPLPLDDLDDPLRESIVTLVPLTPGGPRKPIEYAAGLRAAVLLQVNVADEDTKSGCTKEALSDLFREAAACANLDVRGLMTMAAYSDDPQTARPAFARLRTLRDQLRARTGLPLADLSMGMSNDFEVGVEEGATLVRVGTTLFAGLEGE